MKKDGFINITNLQKNTIFKLTIWNTLDVYRQIKTCLKSLKIITESNEMVINLRSLAKIYNEVKGTKCYYDILIENGKSLNCCSKWEIKLGEGIDCLL